MPELAPCGRTCGPRQVESKQQECHKRGGNSGTVEILYTLFQGLKPKEKFDVGEASPTLMEVLALKLLAFEMSQLVHGLPLTCSWLKGIDWFCLFLKASKGFQEFWILEVLEHSMEPRHVFDFDPLHLGPWVTARAKEL